MKITVQSDRLAAAMKHSVASARSPLPVLQHTRLHVQGNALHVDTTDVEAWVSARIPLVESERDFDIVLRDDLLRPVASAGAGDITIHADGKIKSARGRYNVPGLPPSDFPQVDTIDWQPVQVDAAALAGAIEAAGYAADEDDIRVALKAVHIVPGLVWSADNAQIAAMALDYAGPGLSIPPRHLPRVCAALVQDKVDVSVGNVRGANVGMLRISGPDLQLSLQLMNAEGLDMAAYLDRVTMGDQVLHIPSAVLMQALRRFLPFVQHSVAGTKHRIPEVELRMQDGTLTLHDREEKFSEVVATDVEGRDEWSVAVDIKRLMAAVGAVGGGGLALYPHADAGGRHSVGIVPAGVTHRQAVHLLAPFTR